MTPDDRFAEWDAAYVLGALAPAERHEYEQHLAECPACKAALAELAGVPGLLATLSAAEGAALLEAPPAGLEDDRLTVLPTLLARARRHRTRTRVVASAAALVAVAAAVSLTLVISLAVSPQSRVQAAPTSSPTPGGDPANSVVFDQEIPSPLTAVATFADEPWGTLIEWKCTYGGGSQPEQAYSRGYAMVITDRAGLSTQVATWSSGPGTVALPTATTSIRRADIASATIIATDSGQVLLRAEQ
ncbi:MULTISPECIES: anti-sigma factor family protein [Subtercola]|uniref:Zf-HC2 domain-containing protein n=1 Tax=Subtercola vilae TaxID=2056433 RepID=A0A4T2C814_9MICO|nr:MULTISPECIES: zf-HC2 domain-containing protein [Subtercola]MEA9986821.1 zf-HC2 domain-containing protein [Subtercola sp. RTI3]TIH40367.1 zf-HC2 domain-containing protein [Subtercola vilae]